MMESFFGGRCASPARSCGAVALFCAMQMYYCTVTTRIWTPRCSSGEAFANLAPARVRTHLLTEPDGQPILCQDPAAPSRPSGLCCPLLGCTGLAFALRSLGRGRCGACSALASLPNRNKRVVHTADNAGYKWGPLQQVR